MRGTSQKGRWLLGAGLVLAGIASTWWLFSSRGDVETSPPGRAADHPPTASADAASRASIRPAAPIAVTPFKADTDEPAPDPGGVGRTLTVIGAPDDRPVPGARVEVITASVASYRTRGDQFADGDARAQRFVTDAEGTIVLPPFHDVALVRATEGERLGETYVATDDQQPFRLRISTVITVLVVGTTGAPQPGITIAVNLTGGRRNSPRLMTAATGRDGIARLQTAPPPQFDALVPDPLPTVTLTAEVAMTPQPQASVPVGDIPREPVRIVLPASGTLRVRVTGPDGNPITGPVSVTLGIPAASAPETKGESRSAFVASACATDGVATFATVGLGITFDVTADPFDGALLVGQGSIVGPRSPGEEAVGEIKCRQRAIVVTGRLVDQAGTPLPGARLSAVCGEMGPPLDDEAAAKTNRDSGITQSDGRFRMHFAIDAASLLTPVVWVNTSRASSDATIWKTDPLQVVAIPLPESVRTGPVDLGDVTASEGQVAVAGTVVDELGRPVDHVKVFIERLTASSWLAAPELWQAHVVTGPTGRFAIHGTPAVTPVRVTATKTDEVQFVGHADFVPGARDVRITLIGACAIAGSFRIDAIRGVDPGIRIRLSGDAVSAQDERGKSRPVIELGLDRRGRWSSDLAPGTCDVKVYLPFVAEPALRVDGILLTAGKANHDPRLQDVDLRALMSPITVTVVDDEGTPLAGAMVTVRNIQNASSRRFETEQNGQAIVMAGSTAVLTVQAAHSGFRSALLKNVTSDVTIHLVPSRPQPITVTVDRSALTLPASCEFGIAIMWVRALDSPEDARDPDPNPRTNHDQFIPLSTDGTAARELTEPGVYQVRGMVRTTEAHARQQFVGPPTSWPSVRFTGEAPAMTTLSVDPNQLARSVALLKH